MPGRGITYTQYAVQAEAPVTYLNLGEAAVRITAAELLAMRTAETVRDAAETGRELTAAQRGAIRGESAQVVRLARQAIETLNSLSGASSIQRGVPMQRVFRDIQALALHAALDINTNLEVYGRLIAGLDPNTPFL
jgi:alkylation response protein AidB-like acyl-CoA dehydrogenase